VNRPPSERLLLAGVFGPRSSLSPPCSPGWPQAPPSPPLHASCASTSRGSCRDACRSRYTWPRARDSRTSPSTAATSRAACAGAGRCGGGGCWARPQPRERRGAGPARPPGEGHPALFLAGRGAPRVAAPARRRRPGRRRRGTAADRARRQRVAGKGRPTALLQLADRPCASRFASQAAESPPPAREADRPASREVPPRTHSHKATGRAAATLARLRQRGGEPRHDATGPARRRQAEHRHQLHGSGRVGHGLRLELEGRQRARAHAGARPHHAASGPLHAARRRHDRQHPRRQAAPLPARQHVLVVPGDPHRGARVLRRQRDPAEEDGLLVRLRPAPRQRGHPDRCEQRGAEGGAGTRGRAG
jgi:hypothetical protein